MMTAENLDSILETSLWSKQAFGLEEDIAIFLSVAGRPASGGRRNGGQLASSPDRNGEDCDMPCEGRAFQWHMK
jgi:hypothetical protein